MEKSLEAKVDEAKVGEWIRHIGKSPSASVPLLQAIQSEYGYLPRRAMDLVIEGTEITAAQLFGVATFYSQFRLRPVGRHLIKICHGTACHVRGADRLNTSIKHSLDLSSDESDTSSDGAYTVEDVACVGCCSLAPVMVIDKEVLGELTGATAGRKLKAHAKKHDETTAN